VHEVDGEYDRGPIVLECRCPVEASDTAETLAARVFALEKEAYPAAVAAYLSQRKHLLREEARVPIA
jgi:phosphoribosylglycinamide formyltransferase-1